MLHTLLLADDSVTIQRVIELTFAEENVRVIAVGDGQAAIDRLESDPPDIVLADVDMPKRDGYEVAAYVKSRPRLAHIPVVLLTGAFEPIDQARAQAAGSSDVLAKPFEPQMVINRVRQLLGKKKAEADVMEAPVQAPPLKAPSAPRPPARSGMAMNDEHATLRDQPARMEPGQADSQPAVSLDDYFDQLDAAFSNLQPGAPKAADPALAMDEEWLAHQANLHTTQAGPLITPPAPAPGPNHSEWIDEQPVAVAPPPPPAGIASAVNGAPAPVAPAPVAPLAPVASVVPPAPVAPVAPLAPLAPVALVPPVITDDVIEEVVSRVLQRLSDRVVRETVTEIVTKTAERLVQDEIDRIKSEGE